MSHLTEKEIQQAKKIVSLSKMSRILENIREVIARDRKQKQPLECLNAGSTFKNTKEIQAWKLIDELGLRGFSINDAQVSNKHCNFLINKKECKSEYMMKLINLIKNKVLNKYSIDLQCEWILINF